MLLILLCRGAGAFSVDRLLDRAAIVAGAAAPSKAHPINEL
jgi:hypothetical protein